MGVKYRIEYENYRIEVDLPEYDDEIIDLIGVGGRAGEISFDDNQHIKTSKLNFSFYTDLDLYELQTCNDLEVRVKLYKNNALNWSGFLIADGIKQYYRDRLSAVDLIAVDGLNSSKDIKFTYNNEGRTPLEHVARCLELIGNNLPIRWQIDTFKGRSLTDYAFYGSIGLNRDEFLLYSDVDTYMILEEVLKSFNAEIKQQDGVWYITNAMDKTRTFNGFEYFEGVNIPYTENRFNDDYIILTNDTFFEVKKGVGKAIVKYNPIKDIYAIPNGSFNITNEDNDRPKWWYSDGGEIRVSDEDDERISMREFDDFGRPEFSAVLDGTDAVGYQTYYFKSDSGKKYIPVDGHSLYKNFGFSFRIMPINFPTNQDDEIEWLAFPAPFSIQVGYTRYRRGLIENWYLNENGYWTRSSLADLHTTNIVPSSSLNSVEISFDGVSSIGQYFELKHIFTNHQGDELKTNSVTFIDDFSTMQESLNFLRMSLTSDEIMIDQVNSTTLRFTFTDSPTSKYYSAYLSPASDSNEDTWIQMFIENSKNGDVVEYQYQSKGKQGDVELPDPDDTRILYPDGRGYLTFTIRQAIGLKSIIDELKFNFESVTETYNLKINNNEKEEFELKVGSSFTGFELTSYSNDFSTTDFDMIYKRGDVIATLLEHYGRDILRLNARPRVTWSGTVKGEIKINEMINIKGIDFVPLSLSYNTETNQTSGVFIEQTDNNLDNLEIEITNGKQENN